MTMTIDERVRMITKAFYPDGGKGMDDPAEIAASRAGERLTKILCHEDVNTDAKWHSSFNKHVGPLLDIMEKEASTLRETAKKQNCTNI